MPDGSRLPETPMADIVRWGAGIARPRTAKWLVLRCYDLDIISAGVAQQIIRDLKLEAA